jgi:hypothetical protein
VGDDDAERAVLGSLRIDTDPLVVVGGVGEGVDAILGDPESPIRLGGRLVRRLTSPSTIAFSRRHRPP